MIIFDVQKKRCVINEKYFTREKTYKKSQKQKNTERLRKGGNFIFPKKVNVINFGHVKVEFFFTNRF